MKNTRGQTKYGGSGIVGYKNIPKSIRSEI